MKIKIKGTGTIPVYADGAMRRIEKGVSVEVSAKEAAYLKRNDIPFTKEK